MQTIAPQLIVGIVTPFELRDPILQVSDLMPQCLDSLILTGAHRGGECSIPAALGFVDLLFDGGKARRRTSSA